MSSVVTGDRATHRRGLTWFTAVVVAVAIVWNIVGNLWLPGDWYVPANTAVAVLLVGGARFVGLSWSELGMARGTVPRGVVVGVLSMVFIGAVIAVLVAVPATRGFFESSDVAADGTGERWFTALVRIPLGTAVFEEVLFRGVLFAVLVRRWSTVRAVAVDAVLFGLWHAVPAWEGADGSVWSQGGVIVATVAVTTIAGVGFALLRVRSGSVLAPILAHTATNSFAYVAAVVALETAGS